MLSELSYEARRNFSEYEGICAKERWRVIVQVCQMPNVGNIRRS